MDFSVEMVQLAPSRQLRWPSMVGVHIVVWMLGAIAALSVVGLVLIVIAPWRRVRDETGLPDDVEARLLLGDAPDAIAHDVDVEAASAPPPPVDISRRQRGAGVDDGERDSA